MARITRKSSEVDNRGLTDAPTIDKPGDLATGDFLLVFIVADGTASITAVPSGFTNVASNTSPGSDASVACLCRYITDGTAAAAEGTWTVTMSGTSAGTVVNRISYTGVDPSNPLDVAAVSTDTAASSTTPSAGPITPVNSDAMLVAAHGTDPSAGTYTGTVSSGWTEVLESGVSATSSLYIEERLQDTPSAMTSQPTMSGTDEWASIVVALRPAEAFPRKPVIATFTQADGALDANWSPDPLGFGNVAPTVIGNRAGNASGDGAAYWDTSTFGPSCEVYATIPVEPANNGFLDLLARMASPDTAGVDTYDLQVYRDDTVDDYWLLFRIINQSYTQVGVVTQEWASGDSLGMALRGNVIRVYHKPAAGSWTRVGTFLDSTISAAGYVGMYLNGSTIRLDDFGGGTVVDTVAPAMPSISVERTSGTAATVEFTAPAVDDLGAYTIRRKTGTGQTFSGPTDGTEIVAETAIAPGDEISEGDTGLDASEEYTYAVFLGDGVNWAHDTAEIEIFVEPLEFAPTITAAMAGPVVVGVVLPGAMTASITGSVTVGTLLELDLDSAGLATFDGADIDATGDFPAPVGRNRWLEQLLDNVGSASGRSPVGTPGVGAGRT